MPCQSDHLEPNAREKESVEVCKHLLYVLSRIDKETASLPRFDLVQGAKDAYGVVNRLDEHTAELCRLCRGMNRKQRDTIMYDGRNPQARRLADWWDHHKAYDLARKVTLMDRAKELRDELNKVNKELQEFNRDD
jgi:hypothetical protein